MAKLPGELKSATAFVPSAEPLLPGIPAMVVKAYAPVCPLARWAALRTVNNSKQDARRFISGSGFQFGLWHDYTSCTSRLQAQRHMYRGIRAKIHPHGRFPRVPRFLSSLCGSAFAPIRAFGDT